MTRIARVWNPWQEISRMQQEMGDLFGLPQVKAFHNAVSVPVVNVYQGEKGAIVSAELPGVNVDELDLTVLGETLTLKGTVVNEPTDENVNCQRRERHLRPFERTVTLPFEVDPESAGAVYENGILTVTVSRPVHHQPKKIQLKTN